MPDAPNSNSRRAGRTALPRGAAGGDGKLARTPAKKSPAKRRLPVLKPQRTAVPCLTCGLCCTYIAVGIDGPNNAKAATEILWHLYHHGVSIYRDGDNEWMVQFESRCRHLRDDNKCAIYDKRPHICREYSEVSCEVNAEDTGLTFYAPDEFLESLALKHKRIYRAIQQSHVPAAELLGRAGKSARRHEPFEARFARLRARGEPR
jgi:Fe-S-cluster containining protein